MTDKNLMMTFDDGFRSTCRLPRFSALNMFFRASFNTLILTIAPYLLLLFRNTPTDRPSVKRPHDAVTKRKCGSSE